MALADARRCTATTKSTGERCTQPAVDGYTVCRLHGAGNRNKGKRGGRPIVHGRYSSKLPERLAGKYQEAQADARLLELRDEIALLDVRLGDVLTRIDTGEAGAVWRDLRAAYRELVSSSDPKQRQGALATIAALIDRGATDQALWEEIVGLLDARRRLVESERKRYVEMQQMITSERAMVLLAAVVDVIRNHVHDSNILAGISADVRALVAADPG